jgi:hypothetical protein
MATAIAQPTRPGLSRLPEIVFLAAVLFGVGLFFFPAYVIRPFHYQDPRVLPWALMVKDIAPTFTLLAALHTVVFAILFWKRVATWEKTIFVLGTLLAVGAAVMSRVDYFEWMFHHLKTPGFTTAAATKLDDSEMVMAVRFGNDARAYPIREMAYHHVVNDVVGGVPIAVTY